MLREPFHMGMLQLVINKGILKFNFYKSDWFRKELPYQQSFGEYGVRWFWMAIPLLIQTMANHLGKLNSGDFANGATTIVDNYLVTWVKANVRGSIKVSFSVYLMVWMNGPEHSSARLERFYNCQTTICDSDLVNLWVTT